LWLLDNSILFFLPSGSLNMLIQNYYIAEFKSIPEKELFEQKHLSNGCIEMFIGIQNTVSDCLSNKGEIIITDSSIVGAHDLENSIKVNMKDAGSGFMKFVSVNFRQNGFYSIFKIPESDIHNSIVDSSLVLGNEIKMLQEKLSEARTNFECIKYLEGFLIAKLTSNSTRCSQIRAINDIISFLNSRKGNIKLYDLEDEFGLSERTLQRKFKEETGFRIKEYCKILRFTNLLDKAARQQDIIWADMVSEFGYYDQSHLINEFSNTTGLSPAVFSRKINKSVFKLYNHLVILRSDEEYKTMFRGLESYADAEQIASV